VKEAPGLAERNLPRGGRSLKGAVPSLTFINLILLDFSRALKMTPHRM